MTIDINELRKDKRPQSSTVVHALLDRLEAAEKERDNANAAAAGVALHAGAMQARLEAAEEDIAMKEEVIDSLAAVVKRLDAQCDAAEAEAIEQARLNGMGSEREAALMAKLEAAEKEREVDEQRIADLMADLSRVGHENDALRAKITEMEQQEPVGWLLDGDFYEVRQMSLYKDNEPLPGQTALYALPGVQPAQSKPDGWKLVPMVSTYEMEMAGSDRCDGYMSTAQAVWDAMLAAAPEAKP